MTKPLLLLIDSSNQQCSIALSEGDQIVASADAIEPGSYIHAEQLHVLIQEVMTHHAFDQLDGIVISNGPGSYTGLRIGMSSAKGLAYALDIPLMAVSTLQCIAMGALKAASDGGVQGIWAAMDARRMEVYGAQFDQLGQRLTDDEAIVIEGGELPSEITWLGVGNGVDKCLDLLPNLQAGSLKQPHAKDLLQSALMSWKQQAFEDIHSLEPNYIKDFVTGKPKIGLPNRQGR
ncbi:MAG: tRNA (adenosine(37)-N6)-threonylcarbamoyltransferase complex dimerization subunit type 1 TsaB [Bacteroidetes bacterium]|nr:tRNA (adenosine(37)-N6)-threonylcarbamoyltransferase complex dimerization subunit type 1 TsaB [Bacteroidota bacterium]